MWVPSPRYDVRDVPIWYQCRMGWYDMVDFLDSLRYVVSQFTQVVNRMAPILDNWHNLFAVAAAEHRRRLATSDLT